MSDFSELCPLFNIGIFSEVTFPQVHMTDITACGNALLGTITGNAATKPGAWLFGRTVIVTGAWVRSRSKPGDNTLLRLMHHTAQLIAGTEFATLNVSISISEAEVYTYVPMNTLTAKTFTSSEVLGFTVGTGTAASGGVYDLIVQYREK